MAIDAYTGKPRSGKSYSVVKNVILPSLREGRHVYTNIPLTEKLHAEFGGQIHQLDKDWFEDRELFDKIPYGAVVILDELWRRWPSGLKANMVNFKDKEFLAEHGHLVDEFGNTTRVVLVTQDLNQIAAFARDLVDKTYRSTKLDAAGLDGRFRVDVYEGAVTGQKPPKSQLIRTMLDKYEDSIYQYYRSSTKSMTGDVGDESRADKRSNILRSPMFIAQLVIPLFLVPLGIWYTVDNFTGGMGLVEREDIQEAQAVQVVNPLPADLSPPPPVQQPQALPVVQSGPVESPVWRVAGYIARSADQTRTPDWSSRVGYNAEPDRPPRGRVMPDVVMLASQHQGKRYIPADQCERLGDGVTWTCEVDGYIVTPWSGLGSSSEWAGPQLVTRTASAASGATSAGSASQIVNPPPI